MHWVSSIGAPARGCKQVRHKQMRHYESRVTRNCLGAAGRIMHCYLAEPQPPEPHPGRAQPEGWQSMTGRLEAELGAAGTLSSFSIFFESHVGQLGCSSPRTSNSNSDLHFPQQYSYKGIVVSFPKRIQIDFCTRELYKEREDGKRKTTGSDFFLV